MAGFFSSGVVQEMARRGRSRKFSRLAHESGIAASVGPTESVRDALEVAFAELSRCHRTEYVYKTAIAQNVLLGRHSLNTAVMMTEFRVGACKADVVILNGTSTAYEIKSERDRLDRLPVQVETYLQAFARVNVIASDSHTRAVLALVPAAVGVMRLTPRGSIQTLREPIEDPGRIVPSTLFEALQLHESGMILRHLGLRVPEVPNTRLHCTQRRLFEQLDSSQLHSAMVDVLRVTRSQKPLARLLESVPRSLQAAAIGTRLRRADQLRLSRALDTPMSDALLWA